jgi:hypothetical protein
MSKAEQDAACSLAMTAHTVDEVRRAHLSMRAAFPKLARTYPCHCQWCNADKKTRAGH